MKYKILAPVLALGLIFSLSLSVFAENASVSWYVKKNGSKRPNAPEEQKIIEKYNGYYIDNKLTDDSSERKIYLTFDAGYENGNVAKVLDVLKEKEVPGAFFILDRIVIKDTDLVKRMTDEGHTVCNHTKNHKDISGMSKEEIERNLKALETIYTEKTGKIMSPYFRFPEGKYSEASLRSVCELGYKTVFWSFAYADWDNEKQPDPERSFNKIIENTHNGEVILLHPTSATNAEILPRLIDKWKEMGYTFGKLDELCS